MIRLTGKVREAGKAKGSRKDIVERFKASGKVKGGREGSRHPGRLRATGKVQGNREG